MNLVMKLIEECAELQKALCKAERFGWDACPPKHPGRTNKAHVQDEMNDVIDAMEALIKERQAVEALAAHKEQQGVE